MCPGVCRMRGPQGSCSELGSPLTAPSPCPEESGACGDDGRILGTWDDTGGARSDKMGGQAALGGPRGSPSRGPGVGARLAQECQRRGLG